LPNEAVRKDVIVPPSLSGLVLARRQTAHALVLPRQYGLDLPHLRPEAANTGFYAEFDVETVENLRRGGFDIDYLNDADHWALGSFALDVLLSIGLLICQALAEEEIQTIYRYLKSRVTDVAHEIRRSNPPASIELVNVKIRGGEARFTAENISGPGEQVVDLVKEVLREISSDGQ